MNHKMYTKALRYAFMLMPYHENYYDLVHDAWVAYNKTTGGDLFDQDEKVVIKTVKNCWYNLTRKEFRYHNEDHLRKLFVREPDEITTKTITPDKRVEGEDSIEWLYDQAKKYFGTLAVKNPSHESYYTKALNDTEEIVNLQHQGYKQNEISEKTGVSTTTIKKYMDVLKNIVTEDQHSPFEVTVYNTYNPFAGSKVKVTKTILKSTYKTNKNDQYSEYEYNIDNGADTNEFYTLLTHKQRGADDGLLIRGSVI